MLGNCKERARYKLLQDRFQLSFYPMRFFIFFLFFILYIFLKNKVNYVFHCYPLLNFKPFLLKRKYGSFWYSNNESLFKAKLEQSWDWISQIIKKDTMTETKTNTKTNTGIKTMTGAWINTKTKTKAMTSYQNQDQD